MSGNVVKNIGTMLKERAVVSPQLEAYVEPSANVRMDYTQTNVLANKCASVLTSLGVGKGDRVALLMPNSVEFCCLFYGAAKIGAVAVPLNTRLTAPELEYILSDSATKVLIYGEAFAAVAETIKAGKNEESSRPNSFVGHRTIPCQDQGLDPLPQAGAPGVLPPFRVSGRP